MLIVSAYFSSRWPGFSFFLLLPCSSSVASRVQVRVGGKGLQKPGEEQKGIQTSSNRESATELRGHGAVPRRRARGVVSRRVRALLLCRSIYRDEIQKWRLLQWQTLTCCSLNIAWFARKPQRPEICAMRVGMLYELPAYEWNGLAHLYPSCFFCDIRQGRTTNALISLTSSLRSMFPSACFFYVCEAGRLLVS